MDAKKAKQVAFSALDFFRALEIEPKATDPRIEEIEQSEDGEEWYVTISYARPQPAYAPEARLAKLMGTSLLDSTPPMERDYRRLVVRASDLEVIKIGLKD